MIAPRPSRSRWLIGSSAEPSSTETSTSILSRVFIDINRLTVPAGAIHCEEDAQFMVIEALTTLPSAPAEPAPDLRQRGRDVRALVQNLEGWVIDTLASFNVIGEKRDGRVGVWVRRPDKGRGREDKIAAIGVRVNHRVTFHGIAINVAPELSHYDGIVPCGISDQGVTSLEDLGQLVSMEELDIALRTAFEHRFGPTRRGYSFSK